MITLQSICRYPIKSTRGETLERAFVQLEGIEFDRRWLVTECTEQSANRMITGRTDGRLVRIEARVIDDVMTLNAPGMETLTIDTNEFGETAQVSVWRDEFAAWRGIAHADEWLSDYLGRAVRLCYVGEQSARRVRTHPDVPLSFADGYPLLLINAASVADLSARIGREMVAARFRPSLLVEGAAPFAEDGWRRLRINDVTFTVAKPCSRCVFTTVDPDTGEKSLDQEPLRTLTTFRKREDGVMFGLNLIAENTGYIECGAEIEILE